MGERKAELIEEIQQLEHQSTEVETQMKATSHHLKWSEMPEPDKFRRLAPSRKQLVDTVRLLNAEIQPRPGCFLSTSI